MSPKRFEIKDAKTTHNFIRLAFPIAKVNKDNYELEIKVVLDKVKCHKHETAKARYNFSANSDIKFGCQLIDHINRDWSANGLRNVVASLEIVQGSHYWTTGAYD